ncbi:MAG: LuxR C-terminal-related transcriptional regulator, partial [Actinomycetota bacterium]
GVDHHVGPLQGRKTVRVWASVRAAVLAAPGAARREVIDSGRALAEAAGALTLTVHGRPADHELPLSSLLTLLDAVSDHIEALGEDEAASLRAALDLRGDDVDPRAVRLALWRLLSDVAATRPVAVLVQDSDQVDEVSRDVLAFALGRLDTDDVVVLVAAAPGDDHGLVAVCDRRIELEAAPDATLDLARLGHSTGQGQVAAVAEQLAAPHDGRVDTLVARSAAARWLGGDGAAVADLRSAAELADAADRPMIDALFADAALASGQARTCLQVAAGVLRQTTEGPAAELAGALLVLTGQVDPQPFLDHHPDRIGPDAGPVEVRGATRRAEVQLRFGQLDDAVETLRGLGPDATPWDPAETVALRARALSLRGEPVAAVHLLDEVLDRLPTAARLARAVVGQEQAFARFLLGEVEDAVAALDQVIPLFARARMTRFEAAARLTAGRLAWAMGRTDNGLASLAQARRLDPTGPIGDLVVALVEAGRERDAHAFLDAATDAPTRWRVSLDVLRARANLSDTADGIDRLVAILRERGYAVPLAEVLADRAAWHHRRERWDEVLRSVEEAIKLVIPLGLAGWVPRLDRLEPPASAAASEAAVPEVLQELTAAERRVALAVSRGLTNKAAAQELYVSVKTIDSHLQRIYPKLGVRSRGELAAVVLGATGEPAQRTA